MSVDVDATQAPLKIIHASISLQAAPGPLTLFYPKWIPGEHMPSGPISNLVGLHIFAGTSEIEWRRDLVEMNAFHATVPQTDQKLSITLDYVMPTEGQTYGTAPSADAKCAVLNWYTVVLYPMSQDPDQIVVRASLKVPKGWKAAGALQIEGEADDVVHYAPTTLTALNDNPIILGEHLRSFVLWPAGSDVGEHVIDAAGDSDWAIDFPPARVEAYKRLVRETRRVFGDVGHYRRYHWLFALADGIHGGGEYGVEHHECSDNRLQENGVVDDTAARRTCDLLPHEYFHSWNGKTRRPIGLVNGGYEKPMQDDLLWVYEGLTQYYGEVLAARAGLITTKEWTEALAADAMKVAGPGRSWRPLQDTADSAPFLYESGTSGWVGWRRDVDFYAEGSLIWLEADVIIRRETKGQKTLDDFCSLFFGQKDNGRVFVSPYGVLDVYEALSKIVPHDWKAFFEERLRRKGPGLPLGGVEGSGYELSYEGLPNAFMDEVVPDHGLNALASLGIRVTADGSVVEAYPTSPAFEAGISNGMKIVAVDGLQFSPEELGRALVRGQKGKEPLEFIVKNGAFFRIVHVDYHDGLRYPHLRRTSGKDDVLAAIAKARLP